MTDPLLMKLRSPGPFDVFQRDRLEYRLREQALGGDSTAYLKLRGLRRLWRAQDDKRHNDTTTHYGASMPKPMENHNECH